MPSEWTVDTLKEHFDALRKDDKEAIAAALSAAERANDKAEEASSKRLDGMNEFRNAMDDQQKTLTSLQQHEALKERVDKLETAQIDRSGKAAGITQVGVVLLAAIGVAGTLFTILSAVT